MADLEEQLAQLKLMNSRTLSPKPGSQLTGTAGKKIGPAVPPKPKKPQPLIPKSSAVKKPCEPSYSTMLQQTNGHPLYHHRAAMGKDYSNMKMTLDNPAILEQQREALEHHKRMLDAMKAHPVGGIGAAGCRPQPAKSGHDLNDKIYENQKMLYENTKPLHDVDGGSDDGQRSGGSSRMDGFRSGGGSIYSNVAHSVMSSNDGGAVYGNMRQLDECSASGEAPKAMGMGMGMGNVANSGDVTYCNVNYGGNYQEYFHESAEEELPPPPSPVSSSYSELRRATDNLPSGQPFAMYNHHQHGGSGDGGVQPQMPPIHSMHHHHHGMMGGVDGSGNGSVVSGGGSVVAGSGSVIGGDNSIAYSMSGGGASNGVPPGYKSDYGLYGSQASSTYESIYEPINPRPTSQMSSHSNYSLYTSYAGNPQSAAMHKQMPPQQQRMHYQASPQQPHHSNHKEAEVKILTDLLVQSMDNGQDVDHYGMCVKCGDRVVGESSGCTAMDQIYHIDCFTCGQCQINLQGKPFYALEGKPYCEEDYLNTLEKCSVCMKPILERILRATGKPYHPACFCCIVCGKSLDGIPFTVDATNQIHCIEDFHKKFAPRCCVCCEPIMPGPGKEETVRVVALDRSFHISCYKCEDCGLLLSSEAEGRGCYPLDDHVLCKSCNAKRVQALTSHMTTEL